MLKKLAVLGVVVAGVLAATATGGDSEKAPAPRAFAPLERHEVGSPSRGAATASAIRGARLRFYESRPFTIAADNRADVSLNCNRGWKAINGYFLTNGGIFADANAQHPSRLRSWVWGLADFTGQDGSAVVGIVCLRGIGP